MYKTTPWIDPEKGEARCCLFWSCVLFCAFAGTQSMQVMFGMSSNDAGGQGKVWFDNFILNGAHNCPTTFC
jgi:hypothetical protein